MVTYDGTHFTEIKDKGLVSDVFGEKEMQKMASAGRIGIGHVRYPTAGGVLASDAQPFFVNSPLGIYLVHNGNLTNADELREILRGTDSFFNRHLRTSSDSEVLLNVLADAIHRQHQKCVLNDCCDPETNIQRLVIDAVRECMSVLKGRTASWQSSTVLACSPSATRTACDLCPSEGGRRWTATKAGSTQSRPRTAHSVRSR